MQIVVLYGGGEISQRIHRKGYFKVAAVIDTFKKGFFFDGIPYITIEDYKKEYLLYEIIIASQRFEDEIKENLKKNGIYNYSISCEFFRDPTVKEDSDICHGKWPNFLQSLCNVEGKEILEIGSRVQTGANFRELFSRANYTGFDYYDGENVDVIGDAHCLSEYFGNKKFDLIFSSAVFEHLAMPWIVSTEIIKLLKTGGYVFVETHYSYVSHERPWHFFQFSENALNVLFPEKMGIQCIKKGCCNLLKNTEFSEEASEYLRGKRVGRLYCHSEFLGKKIKDIDESELDWRKIRLSDVVGSTKYPMHD